MIKLEFRVIIGSSSRKIYFTKFFIDSWSPYDKKCQGNVLRITSWGRVIILVMA